MENPDSILHNVTMDMIYSFGTNTDLRIVALFTKNSAKICILANFLSSQRFFPLNSAAK